MTSPDRDTRKLYQRQIKHTVEKAVPFADIDVTKMLSEEELAEIQRQTEQRAAALLLASETSRSELRARLNKTVLTMRNKLAP